MKHLIYLLPVVLFWGCMIDESELPDMHSSEAQKNHGLALFFEQKLKTRLLTRSGELKILSNSHTPLMEYVCYGYSAVYGGHYFIIPLKSENTGQIDAGLVYPLQDGEDLTLSSELATPQLLDLIALNATPDSCRFLLSNKFLTWKKKGLSVSRSLYAYAESLDGKSVFTPSSKDTPSITPPVDCKLTRSTQEYPYEAEIHINYNMTPYVYGEGFDVTVSLPSIEARRSVFVSTFEHLEFLEGVGGCELTSIGAEYICLDMTVGGIGIVEEAVQILMIVAAYRFQAEYGIDDISYYYNYTLTLDSDIISEGSGVGGGNVGGDTEGGSTGGGNTATPGGESGIKPNVNLTDVSKFVGFDLASNNCWRGCTLIMQNYGVPPGSRLHVYRLLAENQTTEELYHYGNNPTDNYARAIACIDRHLDAGRPIVVGVNHSTTRIINDDHVTDHFIVITGRGYDQNVGQYYYIYMETGRYQAHANEGCDTMTNRLYYDPTALTFQDSSAGSENNKTYDVSQVRPNDGINLEETESY